MTSQIQPVARVRLYEQVIEALRLFVQESDLSSGDQLPPERSLAERLGVSRASVKQALLVLEVQGLVEVVHGGGVFLVRNDLRGESLATLVSRRQRLPEILEARATIEVRLAGLAAERRDSDDLAAIERALALMTREVQGGELGESGDRAFHDAIAAASHNAVLAAMLTAIADEVSESRHESLTQSGRPPTSLRQHHRIANAIREGDVEDAEQAMRDHLRSVGSVKLLDWTP